jgi:hypothetical protein
VTENARHLLQQRCLANGLDVDLWQRGVDVLAQAERASKDGKWRRALSAAEAALADPALSDKDRGRASGAAALASCRLRDRKKARRYIVGATEPPQAVIRRRCAVLGVDVTPAPEVDPFAEPR